MSSLVILSKFVLPACSPTNHFLSSTVASGICNQGPPFVRAVRWVVISRQESVTVRSSEYIIVITTRLMDTLFVIEAVLVVVI